MPKFETTDYTPAELEKLRKDPCWIQGQQTKAKEQGFWIIDSTTLRGLAADDQGTLCMSDLDLNKCFCMSSLWQPNTLTLLSEPKFAANLSDHLKDDKFKLSISPSPHDTYVENPEYSSMHYLASSVHTPGGWLRRETHDRSFMNLADYITREDGILVFTYKYVPASDNPNASV